MTKSLMTCLAAAAMLVAGAQPGQAADERSRVLERELAADDLRGLKLLAGNGRARVVPSSDGRVRIRLEVEPKRGSDDGHGWRPWRWFLSSTARRRS